MSKFILSIDQGTTSTKAFLISKDGKVISSDGVPIKQIYPKPGYVEHDAEEIFLSVLKAVSNLLIETSTAPEDIDSISITNQRETTVLMKKANGKPLHNAIVWQCRRTSEICKREKFKAQETFIHEMTGLKLDPYFSATKMRWYFENVPGAEEKAKNGDALMGTIDSFLVYRLTNLKSFKTDFSNAGRTLLFNIHTLDYDAKLAEIFDIPLTALPTACPSCSDFGEVCLTNETLDSYDDLDLKAKDILKKLNGKHIMGVAGDQAAALFGQTCFEKGNSKTTFGTGCFTLMNVGCEPVLSDNGLLTSPAWTIDGKTVYALEGSVFQGGSIISWLKDEMGLINKPSDCDVVCNRLENNGGVYFVPAFTGLSAPYWNSDVRGAIMGLTRGTGADYIVRAGVEAISYQVADLIKLMQEDLGLSYTEMKVDGGVTRCNFAMQLLSDVLRMRIVRAASDEMTAAGVAYMAGLNTGFFESMEEVKSLYKASVTYEPVRDEDASAELLAAYRKCVNTVIGGETL